MTLKMESPAASGQANGAKSKAGGFTVAEYRTTADAATPFTHIGTAALRVVHLASRHGLTVERAAMLAGLVYGEAR